MRGRVSNAKHWNENKDIPWGRKIHIWHEGKKLNACHRSGKERRNVPNQREMRKFSRRHVGARLNRECFKSITKLSRRLFPRHSAITPLVDFHAAINRNEAGIGIEAKREEENNTEKREQFWGGSHNKYSTLKSLCSKWQSNQAKVGNSILPSINLWNSWGRHQFWLNFPEGEMSHPALASCPWLFWKTNFGNL